MTLKASGAYKPDSSMHNQCVTKKNQGNQLQLDYRLLKKKQIIKLFINKYN